MDTSAELSGPATAERAADLYREHLQALQAPPDRMFAWLLPVQWAAAVATAAWISPLTWIGARGQTHLHVWAALLLGGLIVSLPVALAVRGPGRASTRHVDRRRRRCSWRRCSST